MIRMRKIFFQRKYEVENHESIIMENEIEAIFFVNILQDELG